MEIETNKTEQTREEKLEFVKFVLSTRSEEEVEVDTLAAKCLEAGYAIGRMSVKTA